ncbi:transposase [Streptomyces viridosporus]|uniref:IS110 family transposase n=1 Tax=Streptomyces viridosporus TaxID=67581 RepID=UPI0036F9093D
MRATGQPVYAINPLAVARYRDRHTVARRKSDAVDAADLANILRSGPAQRTQRGRLPPRVPKALVLVAPGQIVPRCAALGERASGQERRQNT